MYKSNCCLHGKEKVHCDKTNKQFFLLGHAEAEWLDIVYCPWCASKLDVNNLIEIDDEKPKKKRWLFS